MSGGYGRSRWGRGPWGGSQPSATPSAGPRFESPLYPVPNGSLFGRVAISRFSGEPADGPLSGSNGLVFFSSALLTQSSSNSVDFASVSVLSIASDRYRRPQERSSRLFRFGGGPGCVSGSWPSLTNAALYRTQPIGYTAVATLVQTMPPGPTTVIKIP